MGGRCCVVVIVACWCGVVLFGKPVFAEDAAAPDGEFIVDRVVAFVGAAGDRGADLWIVTAYEQEIEARLMLAERLHGVEAAVERELPERFLTSVLRTIINHLLIQSEATRLDLVAVSDEEVAAERQLIEERLRNTIAHFCTVSRAPVQLVEAIVQRRALVASFIRRNIHLVTQVTDDELHQTYTSGEHPFGDRPLEEIRAPLEAYIIATNQRQRLSDWIRDARRRNRVRMIPE